MHRRTTGLALTMVIALIQLSCGVDAVGEGEDVTSDDSASGDAESKDVTGEEGSDEGEGAVRDLSQE